MIDRSRYDASPGAWEFLEEKQKILSDYDSARRQGENRQVRTEHGNVAEATLRRWLEGFLPRKYGVCRGFVIETWLQSLNKGELRHYDVIIYDALNAPVMWAEDNPDVVPERRNQAIPARHVIAILEVKARLNGTESTKATSKLIELNELRASLHPNFCCGFVFFEVDPLAEHSKAALDNLMPSIPVVGLFGGLILRGNGIASDLSGELRLVASPKPSTNHVAKDVPLSNDKGQWNGSASVEWANPQTHAIRAVHVDHTGSTKLDQVNTAHHYLNLTWGLNAFSSFAFDLLERLEGRIHGLQRSVDSPLIVNASKAPTS